VVTGRDGRAATALHESPPATAARRGLVLLLVVTGLVLAVMAPGVVGARPLADDHEACVALRERNLVEHLDVVADYSGLVRPARYVEVTLTALACPHVPFGLLAAVPLALTLGVAWAARGLLQDLGVREPWPSVGAALTLLEPLGTEAALWPSALHVPLGLLLALLSLRLFRRDRLVAAAVLALLACWSTEHALFALPLAAAVVARPAARRRAALVAAAVVAGVLVLYSLVPGASPRAAVSIFGRVENVVTDVGFYARFPAIGLGLQSIPAAVAWALPWSLAVLAGGVAAGRSAGPWLLGGGRGDEDAGGARRRVTAALVLAGLLVLVNVPLITTAPHEDSPRTFTATWLVLSLGAAWLGSTVRWRRPAALGAAAGAFAAGALLSLALSVGVRLETAAFNEGAFAEIAAQVEDQSDVVAVCHVQPRVTSPSPAGAFTLHELFYDWAPGNALQWYEDEQAEFLLFEGPCPDDVDADVVVDLPSLVARHAGG
jgi:hypothetical protein